MKEPKEPDEPVYSASNEPYLGLESVFHVDQNIMACLERNGAIAAYTHAHQLSDLQKAACQIIPQGINLTLSIRELVRQGYLFGAAVLLRSLVERAAMITYLREKPEAVELWKGGWGHRKRPSLPKMLEVMGGDDIEVEEARKLAKALHHITHGDPIGSFYNLVHVGEGNLGYSVTKVTNDPELCDFVCGQAVCYLIVLMATASSCFPDVVALPENPEPSGRDDSQSSSQ